MESTSCIVCGSSNFSMLCQKEGQRIERCLSCKLLRNHPQPSDSTLAKIYGTHYYEAWGGINARERVYLLKKATFRTHVLNHLALAPGSRILDCGAAWGALMEVAAEMALVPYGIEIAGEAAKKIADQFGCDHVFSGPFEAAHFPGLQPCKFDAITMCDFIEHVRNPRDVLAAAHSLLKPGGYLAITTPNGESASCRALGPGWPHYKIEHLHYFGPTNIRTLLEQTGFIAPTCSRAWKCLNLEYIQHQFKSYPRALITPGMNLLSQLVGDTLRKRSFSVSFGEMLVITRRQA